MTGERIETRVGEEYLEYIETVTHDGSSSTSPSYSTSTDATDVEVRDIPRFCTCPVCKNIRPEHQFQDVFIDGELAKICTSCMLSPYKGALYG